MNGICICVINSTMIGAKCCFVLLLLIFSKENSCENLVKETVEAVQNVLNFLDHYYDELNFDGLFGMTLAQAYLEDSFMESENVHIKHLLATCSRIRERVVTLLSYPAYENVLLNVTEWMEYIKQRPMQWNSLPNLGIYRNWTVESIRSDRQAIYKGLKSDVCIKEILESGDVCYVSGECKEMMWDQKRIDRNYLLTHRLLYFQLINLKKCKSESRLDNNRNYIKRFCTLVYKEAKTNQYLNYAYHDIFLEQIVLCGMEGYGEFFHRIWLNAIIEWQSNYGCFASWDENLQRRSSNVIAFGCTDHTTGLGLASLSLYLRLLIKSGL